MADEIDNGSPAVEAVESTPAVETVTETNQVDAASPKSREPDVNRSALEERVAKSLAGLREIDAPVESKEPEVEAEVESDTEEADNTADTETAETEEQDEPTDETEQQPVAKKTGPTLPGHLMRSLKAYGWDDADIETSYAAGGEKFLLMAQKIHNNRNQETAQWAEAGRAARANEPQQEATPKANDFVDPKTGGFKLLDVEAMGEEYGNPELVTRIVSPVNAVLQRINAILPDLMNGVQTVQRSRTDQLATQIDGFFASPDLKPFTEAYGKDSSSLSEGQIETRNKVLELADALVAGAKAQNRKLSVPEALMIAHDHVSSGLKETTIRKKIVGEVKKRGAGITIRPGSGNKGGSGGPPKNKTELETRVSARLASIFPS